MRLYHRLLGTAFAVIVGASFAPVTASAADNIFVPLLSYRTGPFAVSGAPIMNGMADYLNMLNERDGGIGGVKILVEECETGYDTKKGVECYEQVKSRNPVVINPYSTGITLQIIPKAAVDKIPILSMAYGLRRRRTAPRSRGFSIRPRPLGRRLDVHPHRQQGRRPDKLKGKKVGLILSGCALRARNQSRSRGARQGLRL